ncbi:MAG TPA: DUF962 domain-containing protein [Saprospiraceae bacterium]|nr:DUF962 domain-containing protein [Saprospiraceae bacterium]
MERIESFRKFYPYYLLEHQNPTCVKLHFIGTGLFILCLGLLIVTGSWWYLLLGAVCGYGFAWVGHFFFEKNKPATFQYPFWSLSSDFVMFYDLLRGAYKRRLKEAKAISDEK